MKLYDQVIAELKALLPESPAVSAYFEPELCAPAGDKNAILFGSETAFELGGSGKPAVSSVMFGTVDSAQDEVLVYGSDLFELTEDTPFAHLTLVQLRQDDEAGLRSEQLKDVGFCLFQLYPKGYQIRISPSAGREQVRVAKAALQTNPPLSFINVGCSLIRLLKENGNVARVQTIFIAGADVDYKGLAALSRKVKQITDAVQSTLALNALDCASCKMKPVCDEVDGLRELHFNKERERKKNGT